jgi:hypothetical protein
VYFPFRGIARNKGTHEIKKTTVNLALLHGVLVWTSKVIVKGEKSLNNFTFSPPSQNMTFRKKFGVRVENYHLEANKEYFITLSYCLVGLVHIL